MHYSHISEYILIWYNVSLWSIICFILTTIAKHNLLVVIKIMIYGFSCRYTLKAIQWIFINIDYIFHLDNIIFYLFIRILKNIKLEN